MPFQQITVTEFQELLKDQSIHIIDIRDPASYSDGHIENALNINQDNIEQFIQDSDLDKPLVVCCYHGNSSQGAAEFMNQRGFKTTYSLVGGFEEYRNQVS